MLYIPASLRRRTATLATLLVSACLLSACATRMDVDPNNGAPQLRAQNRLLLTPDNGGREGFSRAYLHHLDRCG